MEKNNLAVTTCLFYQPTYHFILLNYHLYSNSFKEKTQIIDETK